MEKFSLNGTWKLKGGKYDTEGQIPGSVYSILLANNLMEDPYYRDNELKALEIMDNDFEFSRTFNFKKTSNKTVLVLEGVDTLCDMYINGKFIAHLENMHRTYKIDVTDFLVDGENEIKAFFPWVDKYIKEKLEEKFYHSGSFVTMKGYMYLRKAHCMFGWDWGPRLPDAGIWRDIYLINDDIPHIDDVRVIQRHDNGKVFVTVSVEVSKESEVEITLTSPKGEKFSLKNGVESEIANPMLWWIRGYGEQYLYDLTVKNIFNGEVVDEDNKKIGLRTLTIAREKDEWGESFCHEINGVKIFAFGADYIPEDNIIARASKERTRKLLEDCVRANHNAIRVWGGGYYPEDWLFELCDELGLVMFLDCMYACTAYPFSEEFMANMSAEIVDNMKRIRHHACIGIIAGNNEIEEECFWWSEEEKAGYLEWFENRLPKLMNELCPEIVYVSSSPSSHGAFVDTQGEECGDNHYWSVWHQDLPFTEYRHHYFRYLSEFGFQSFPTYKTIEEFTLPEDRNPFSRIMEMHQRNPSANGKILNYLSQTYLYPMNFEVLVYASQLLQAEAIKYGVEHLRRNRGRCMGALYWQLNDIWPVASWSSIDSNGRWKALHYESKRFYEPIHISCAETGEYSVRKDITDERIVGYETKAHVFVNNDTLNKVSGFVVYKLIKNDGTILEEKKVPLTIDALSYNSLDEIDFNKTDVRNNYLWFGFEVDGKIISSGTVLFTKPKHFNFINPNLSVSVDGDKIKVKADAYARYVEILNEDGNLILSDNYFDMNKGEVVVSVLEGNTKGLKVRSVYDIK